MSLEKGVSLSDIKTWSSDFLATLDDMRQNGELCDVKIVTRNRTISAHRVVLSGLSPVFRAMFMCGMRESHQEEIPMKDVDPDDLECLINFAYGKRLEITLENVMSLLAASDFLQNKPVKEACHDYIETNLRSENVLEIRNFAEFLSNLEVMKQCDLYIRKNFDTFFESEVFFSCPFSVLKDVIQQSRETTRNPKMECEAIMAWTKTLDATDEKKQTMLFDLLQSVNLKRLNVDFLFESIATEKLIKTSTHCRDLVEKAKESHFVSISKSWRSWTYQSYFDHRVYYENWLYSVCCSENYGLYGRIYDPSNEKWITLGRAVPMKSGFTHVVSESDSIHVYGFKSHAVFHLSTSTCIRKEGLEHSFFFNILVIHQEKLYVFDNDPCSNAESFSNIRCFNFRTDECTVVGKKLKNVFMPSVASVGEYIYFIGGRLDGRCSDLVERYHPESRQWKELPPMPTRRYCHSSAVLNESIYVCGGRNDSQRNLDTVEIFFTLTRQWVFVSPMKVPRSRFSLTCWKERIVAIGGAETSGDTYSVEIFDHRIGTWRYGAPLRVWDDVSKTEVQITSLPRLDYTKRYGRRFQF